MAEPTSTAAATLAAATAALPVLTAFGVPLGLRADLLIAGFAGSLVAIILLNTCPAADDTWSALVRVTLRRMAVVLASAMTAGYLTPMVLLLANVPDSMLLGGTFGVGAGAQPILVFVVDRLRGRQGVPT